MHDTTVILLAYNEQRVIERSVREVRAASPLDESMGRPWTILVVDDGSTDQTPEILATLAAEDPYLEIATHPTNLGRGRALRTAFAKTETEYLVCLDADLSYSVDHIPKLLDPLRSGLADITLASAYHPQGKVINVPFTRLIVSRIGNRILSWGLRDRINTVTCMVRGFRRDAIQSMHLRSDDKDLHLEILDKAIILGFRIQEVPAKLEWRERDRPAGGGLNFLFKAGKTFASHLLYSYMLRPSVVAKFPIIALLGVLVIGLTILGFNFGNLLFQETGNISDPLYRIYYALRETLVQGQVTAFVIAIALIFIVQIVSLLFLAQTVLRQFGELFYLLNGIERRLNDLEQQQKD